MITRYSCSQKDLINEQVILALTLLFEQCCITSYLRMRRTNPFSSFIVSLSIEESTQQLNFSLAGLWCLTSYVCLCVRSSLASCTPAMLSALSLRRRTAVSDLTHTHKHTYTHSFLQRSLTTMSESHPEPLAQGRRKRLS